MWSAIKEVFLPCSCAGCGCDNAVVCSRCCHMMMQQPFEASALSPVLDGLVKVWALSIYEHAPRRLVLSAKHDERRDMTDYLCQWGMSLGKHMW